MYFFTGGVRAGDPPKNLPDDHPMKHFTIGKHYSIDQNQVQNDLGEIIKLKHKRMRNKYFGMVMDDYESEGEWQARVP